MFKFEKFPFGPITSPNPGPTLEIDVAAADIAVTKFNPLTDGIDSVYYNLNECTLINHHDEEIDINGNRAAEIIIE